MSISISINRSSHQLGLTLTGVFCAAVFAYAMTPTKAHINHTTIDDPAIIEVLAAAKKHAKSGEWETAAMLLADPALTRDPNILLEQARFLLKGWGQPRNLDKAREKLLQAVQHDFPKRGETAFELAQVFRKSVGEDCTRISYEWFIKAAAWGYTKAHAELGKSYSRGIGVKQDMAAALVQFEKAAAFGSASSLVSFVKLLSKNPDLARGLPDLEALTERAVVQLQREATGGNAASAKALGRLYIDGDLKPADRALAITWLRRGARLGDAGAMFDLALMMLDGEPTRDYVQQALDLLHLAGEKQNGGALAETGRVYLSGRFGLNPAESIPYFRRGITLGHPGAMLEMARLNLEGTLVPFDRTNALNLAKRGAALGHKGSISLLKRLTEPHTPTSTASIANSLPELRKNFSSPNSAER